MVLVMKSQAGGKIALGIILMLFFSSLFASALITLSKAETTETVMWIVDDDGSAADFSSIQAAIDAAKFGDTVYVRSGHYYEHVLVNKGVKLLGENKTSTLIDAILLTTLLPLQLTTSKLAVSLSKIAAKE